MSSLLYIPCSSLNKEDIQSLVNLSLNGDVHHDDTHGGRKVAIKYLSHMNSIKFDLSSFIDSKQLKSLEKEVEKLKKIDLFKKEFDQNGDDKYEPYWEINNNSPKIHSIAKQSRLFTNKDPSFSPEQLKVYFNSTQISNIPYSNATFETAGFVDNDARNDLIKYPLSNRQNKGQINTKKGRIESVIYDIPLDKQVIILDFADERMPGGLFLYGASTQEETICYNSNTYRGLLDLKYERFNGGFFIPEFGCLYIKNSSFYKPPEHKQTRQCDVIAAACYDLTGEHGLYPPPKSQEEIDNNTRKKFQTIISAAQANSNGSGNNTYLILGPIGCGAFQNKLSTIAKLWAEVLLEPLNEQLNTQQRHAFEHIWFLSGTDQKLQVFEQNFGLSQDQRL